MGRNNEDFSTELPESANNASVEHHCDAGEHKVNEDVRCFTPDCKHKGKSWDNDGHQDWDHDYACSKHYPGNKG